MAFMRTQMKIFAVLPKTRVGYVLEISLIDNSRSDTRAAGIEP